MKKVSNRLLLVRVHGPPVAVRGLVGSGHHAASSATNDVLRCYFADNPTTATLRTRFRTEVLCESYTCEVDGLELDPAKQGNVCEDNICDDQQCCQEEVGEQIISAGDVSSFCSVAGWIGMHHVVFGP